MDPLSINPSYSYLSVAEANDFALKYQDLEGALAFLDLFEDEAGIYAKQYALMRGSWELDRILNSWEVLGEPAEISQKLRYPRLQEALPDCIREAAFLATLKVSLRGGDPRKIKETIAEVLSQGGIAPKILDVVLI